MSEYELSQSELDEDGDDSSGAAVPVEVQDDVAVSVEDLRASQCH